MQVAVVQLFADEIRRIASNIAKLPTILGSTLPDDAVNNLSDERHAAEDTTPKEGASCQGINSEFRT